MAFKNEQIENLIDLSKKQVEKEMVWMQGILVMASSFLGLLIALHTKTSKTESLHILYSSILCIIGLGILSGVIYLFVDSNTQERLRKKYLNKVLKHQEKSNELTVVPPYKIFALMRWVSCSCFFLSVPLLIYYAIMVDSLNIP